MAIMCGWLRWEWHNDDYCDRDDCAVDYGDDDYDDYGHSDNYGDDYGDGMMLRMTVQWWQWWGRWLWCPGYDDWDDGSDDFFFFWYDNNDDDFWW